MRTNDEGKNFLLLSVWRGGLRWYRRVLARKTRVLLRDAAVRPRFLVARPSCGDTEGMSKKQDLIILVAAQMTPLPKARAAE